MRKIAGHRSRGRLTRAITRPPFRDRLGHKGWLTKISRAQQHIVRHLHLEIARWPQWSRPLRIAFLSDFHTGSHSDDVARLNLIIDEAASITPDLALFGGGLRQYAAIWRWPCTATHDRSDPFTSRSAARSFRNPRES
jgi:hypothetical protein